MLKQFVMVLGLCGLFTCVGGCTGVEQGVADAPEEPAPELTADEEAAEREYTTSEEYR